MEIFEWVKEIENIYKDLIDKAKSLNLTELEDLRIEQEKYMENRIENNNKIVESALNSQLKILSDENSFIAKKIEDFKNKMDNQYQSSKKALFKLLIKDIGFDF
ncbi:MAG: hypothetical protein ACFFA3_05075 [Promethearchaeota archaeon]